MPLVCWRLRCLADGGPPHRLRSALTLFLTHLRLGWSTPPPAVEFQTTLSATRSAHHAALSADRRFWRSLCAYPVVYRNIFQAFELKTKTEERAAEQCARCCWRNRATRVRKAWCFWGSFGHFGSSSLVLYLVVRFGAGIARFWSASPRTRSSCASMRNSSARHGHRTPPHHQEA